MNQGFKPRNQNGQVGKNDSCLNSEKVKKKDNITSEIKSKLKVPKGK